MKIATAKSNATPAKPCNLGGYGTRDHVFESIHDPIECVVLWIKNESGELCFVSLDVIGFNEEFCDKVRTLIKEEINIPADNIIVNAIHSHSSPMVGKGTKYYAIQPDPAYEKQAVHTCAETAIKAHRDYREVQAFFSKFEVDGIYSNRNDIHRLGDKWFYLIEFKQGKTTVMSYADISCHSTVLGPDNYACSGDLVGNLRRELEHRMNAPMILTVGNAGDMSNRQYRQGNDFVELNRVVNAIADQVVKHRATQPLDLSHFVNLSFEYPIHYKMNQDEVRASIDDYEDRLKTATNYDQIKLIKAGIAAFKRKQHYDIVDFVVKCRIIRFEELDLVTMPGELVSKLGLWLKEASKKPCCVVQCYTNGSIGYIVEREEYGKAHESNASLLPIGEPEKIVESIRQQLKR